MARFSIGDRVKVIKLSQLTGSSDCEIGSVGTVMQEDTKPWCKMDGINSTSDADGFEGCCAHHEDDLELVKENNQKIKAGDEVRILKDNDCNGLFKIGEIRKVVALDGNGYRVAYGNGEDDDFYMTKDEIELVESTTIKNITSKTMNYIKKLTQSKADKALEKAGFLNDCGDLTSEGKAALESLAYRS